MESKDYLGMDSQQQNWDPEDHGTSLQNSKQKDDGQTAN